MKLRLTLVLLCCATATAAHAQPPDAARKGTIAYVQKLQQKNGAFLAAEPDPKSNQAVLPTLRATSSAIRALKYLGGELPNKEGCKKFVASCFDKTTGGFADLPGKQPNVFTTAVGLMAVAELGMPAEPYHAAAVKYLADHVKTFDDVRIAVAGLERIKAKAPKAAAWSALVEEEGNKKTTEGGLAREVASYAVSKLRLGEALNNFAEVLKRVKADQRNSGGFGKGGADKADLESSYRVMRLFMMLKKAPADVEGLRSFVAKCRNEDGGYGIAPGEPSSIGATYFAVIVTHWLDEAEKREK